MRKFHQGKYRPKNLHKYQGDATEIRYLSSWERSAFLFLDMNPACVSWGSETVIIPYFSPVDMKNHRYYVDLKATFKLPNGTLKTFLIEIKPAKQCLPSNARTQKRLIEETATYMVNQSKWKAAEEYAKKNGWEFKVITENELFGKK